MKQSQGLIVLLADDHPLIVEAFTGLLLKNFNVTRLLHANSMETVTATVKKEKRLDLVILDMILEDGNSVSLINYIKQSHPNTRLLVATSLPEERLGKQVIDAGADGFVNKKKGLDEMLQAIKTVVDGKKFLSEELMYKLVFNKVQTNPFDELSTREFEIVMHLLNGKSIGAIAGLVNLERSTVSTHKANAFEKLGVKNMLDLQQEALNHNIISK